MKFDAHKFWVGQIPPHWRWNRIGDNFEVLNGFPFESSFFNSNGDGMPLVRIRDILSSDFGTFYNGQSGLSTTVVDEDIVIGMDGDFNSCWWVKGTALLNQRVAALRSKKKSQMDGRYAHYQIPFGLKIINDLTSSSTVKHLSSGDIAALRLPAPSLPTQKRIAAFLDRETAQIDALIAKKERLIAVLTENQLSAISGALTTGVNSKAKLFGTGSKYIPEVPRG